MRDTPHCLRKFACTLGLCLLAGITHADDFTNFIGMQFVDLPGSNLQMGKTEVTLGQFRRFMAARGSNQFETDNRYGDEAPVVDVSWNDAGKFIDWLNRSKAATDQGLYRLPSEAEWETACRAGGNHPYCGGDEPDAIGWFDQNSGYRPHAVATRLPNAFGLHDMSGNVAEWTASCWLDSATTTPTSGNCVGRVVRGGSWLSYDGIMLGAERYFEAPASRSYIVGFRVVRTLAR
jgi:formylglycine-generating enzyme required for sulfatase activity